jgi:MFS transporter, SHS family, lactate transporter
VTAVTWAITLTLAMRTLGAWIFGRVADRFGRWPTLIVDVLCYAALEFASGFAPSLTIFIVLARAVWHRDGWRVGRRRVACHGINSPELAWTRIGPAAIGLSDRVPARFRSILGGFSGGWLAGPVHAGALPALLVLYIRRAVRESPDWEACASGPREPIFRVLRRHAALTASS